MSQPENKKELLNSWVKSYYGDLYRWAKFKISDAHLAEDLVQEVFLIASDNFEKFKNESSPKTWLFRILNNKLVDQYRVKTNRKVYPMEETQLVEITESLFDKNSNWTLNGQAKVWNQSLDQDMDLELEQNLSHCMYSLPELWKKVVFEKYFENQDTDKICASNELSKANYWQIMHRMKLFLKDCIEKMVNKNH
jgi:RNA polymerase sigma-70 factor (ECF subfamily)